MKIRYFSDTDTALIEFSNVSVVETKEISENIYIDLDEKGNLVSMTIEHAKPCAELVSVEKSRYFRSFFSTNGKDKCLMNQSTLAQGKAGFANFSGMDLANGLCLWYT